MSQSSGNITRLPSNATSGMGVDDVCIVDLLHDYVFTDIARVVQGVENESFATTLLTSIGPYAVLGFSLFLVFSGYYAMRFVIALSSFAVASISVARLARYTDGTNRFGSGDDDDGGGVTCDGMTVAMLLVGGVSALTSALMMRPLSMLIGGVCMVGVVVSVFTVCGNACYQPLWKGAPTILDLPLVQFWMSMALALGAGALIARTRYRELIATMSAILGSYGIAISLRHIAFDDSLPSYAFSIIIVLSTAMGLGTQYLVYTKRREARERAAAASSAHTSRKKKKQGSRTTHKKHPRDDSEEEEV